MSEGGRENHQNEGVGEIIGLVACKRDKETEGDKRTEVRAD